MQPPRDESTLGRAMDRLLDCGSPFERARILLDAVLDDGLASAAALWRRVGGGPVRAWHPLVSRGAASCLPTLDQVDAASSSELNRELPLRGLVLFPANDHDIALALGEVEASADRLAEVEGLLSVWAAIEHAEQLSSAELLDALPAPTPHSGSNTDETLGDLDAQLDELWELLDRSTQAEEQHQPLCTGTELAEVLEFELARRLGVDTEVRWRMDEVPDVALDDELLSDLTANLLEGLDEHTRRVRVELGPSSPTMPGAILVIESDTGWPPSLGGLPTDEGHGLALAAAELADLGGSLGIEQGPWRGLRLTAWIPARGL